MQQIDFYCKKCKKSMKMSYMVSGDKDAPILTRITIRCHTNKCTRVVMLKNFTEGDWLKHEEADALRNLIHRGRMKR